MGRTVSSAAIMVHFSMEALLRMTAPESWTRQAKNMMLNARKLTTNKAYASAIRTCLGWHIDRGLLLPPTVNTMLQYVESRAKKSTRPKASLDSCKAAMTLYEKAYNLDLGLNDLAFADYRRGVLRKFTVTLPNHYVKSLTFMNIFRSW